MTIEDTAIERLQSAIKRMAPEYAAHIMSGLPRYNLYTGALGVLRRLQYLQVGNASSMFAQSLLETLMYETEKICKIETEKINKEFECNA